MSFANLVTALSERTGVPAKEVRAILHALRDEILESLGTGTEITIPGLGRFGSRWQEQRTLRAPGAARRVLIDGRFLPRFHPAERLREAVARRTPQLWRDPAHQEAWRLAETLLGDLALYHRDRAPTLSEQASLEDIRRDCERSFGPLWARVESTFERQVDADVRSQRPYLLLVARRRWSAQGH